MKPPKIPKKYVEATEWNKDNNYYYIYFKDGKRRKLEIKKLEYLMENDPIKYFDVLTRASTRDKCGVGVKILK